MKKITVFTFFAILFSMSYFTFSTPIQNYSESQNRTLQPPPKLTSQTLKDRTFIKDYDNFISDHLIFSNSLLKLKTRIELFIGKNKVNDIYINENMLIKDINQPSEKEILDKVNAINYFADIYDESFQTHIMVVPTAIEIYSNQLPQYTSKLDQVHIIDNIYKQFKNVSPILANPQLVSNSDSYLYYKTDTTLTSYGAYILYTTLSKELGYKPIAFDRFNTEYASHNFLGDLYSSILYGEDLEDNINLYHYSGENPIQDVIKYEETGIRSYNSIFFREYLDSKNQNSVFLGNNEDVIRIRCKNTNDKKLLIFSDETANPLMQFLPLHYQEIALVDLSLLNHSIYEDIDLYYYDQVLFLYDLDNFMNDLIINLQLL